MSKAVTRSTAESSGPDEGKKAEPMIEESSESTLVEDPSSSARSSGEMRLLLEERKRVARRISRQKRSQERDALCQEILDTKEELESMKSGSAGHWFAR